MYLQFVLQRSVTPVILFFFFNDTATTEIYTSFPTRRSSDLPRPTRASASASRTACMPSAVRLFSAKRPKGWRPTPATRSEEHTSELQSQSNLVCRLLLEKKQNSHVITAITHRTDIRSSPLDT